jgi:flagellin
MVSATGDADVNRLIIFRKDGGDNNNLVAEERITAPGGSEYLTFVNAQTGDVDSALMNFTLGGEDWGEMVASQQKNGGYSLTLLGRDIGDGMDIFIADSSLVTADTAYRTSLISAGIANAYIANLKRSSFTEIQDAADGRWDGAEIRTQEAAQKALLAVNAAIEKKDVIRANIGAIQNRLEGTITNLTIQVENLQASESRISDVDVATEMTEFTKNNILAQAATAMLAQANSLGALALSLING